MQVSVNERTARSMVYIFFIALFSFSFFAIPIFAQITEKQLIDILAREPLAEARRKIDELATRHPDSPAVLYMQASITEDAQKAFERYKALAQKFPRNPYGVKAAYRIGQFYFARGFYYTARKYFQDVALAAPSPRLKDMAQYYAAKCLFAAGKRDSAKAEWQRLKQTTRSQLLLALLEDDLRAFNPGGTARLQSNGASAALLSDARTPQYAIQIGSFRKRENAESQKKYFGLLGYPVEIQVIERKKKPFYRVVIGQFENRDTAKKFGEAFKQKFQISYQIIKRNEGNHD